METVLEGRKGIVYIAPDRPTVLISKPAVPSRRKRSTNGSVANYIEIAKNEALAQVAAGADVVDIDVDRADSEQEFLLPRVVETVQQMVEIPLCLNAPNPAALAAALAVYQGKPLVNAVSGDEESLSHILPLIARYRAAVIGLCVDEQGIPPDDPYGRLEIARKIVKRAEALNIPREDILIDCQVLPLETDHQAAQVTLETIRLVKTALGVNLTLDVGNISNELPNYTALHQNFLGLAMLAGVNAPIINASQGRQTILAMDLMLGRDANAERYIKYYHYRRSGIRNMVDWELVG